MRDIKQLNPELQAIIPTFLADCKSKGLIVGIGECYRTVTEQEALYAKGRTTGTKGAIVTNCRGTSYSSPHQWGVAFDFYRNDGKGIFDDRDGWFAKVGAVGKAHGLEWGGDWQGWCDKPHLQLKKFFRDGTTKYLKQTYGTPGKFMATWSNQIADNSVKSDTTCDMTMRPNAEYTVKLTSAVKPTVTIGTSGVLRAEFTGSSGNDYLYRITAIGKSKTGAGIFANGKKIFTVNIS